MINDLLNVGDRHVAFNGERLNSYFIVRGIDMPMLPEITVSELIVAGRPGSWYSGRQIGTRDIIVKVGILNKTAERVEALNNWVNTAYRFSLEGEQKLSLGGGYYVNAVLSGRTPITKRRNWHISELTFHCCDPFIYRNTYEVPLVNGDNLITVQGTCQTSPIIEVNPTSQNFELIKGSKRVKVDNAPTSAMLTVNMELRKCTVNDAYRACDPTITKFWNLDPGENKVTLKNGSGTLKYTEVYI